MRQFSLQLLGKALQIDLRKELLDCLSAHGSLDAVLAELFAVLVVLGVGQDILLLNGRNTALQHDIAREIQHLLKILRRHVENQAHTAGNALEVPDVGNRRSELDVAHSLTANLRIRNLDTATVADEVLRANLLFLVFAAMALVLLGGSEDLLTEQTADLRLQGSVVDGLRLLHLVVGYLAGAAGTCPLANLLGRGQTDTDGIIGDLFYFLIQLVH